MALCISGFGDGTATSALNVALHARVAEMVSATHRGQRCLASIFINEDHSQSSSPI